MRAEFAEAGLEVLGPGGVPLLAVERRAHQLLEVGRLGVDEQLVDGRRSAGRRSGRRLMPSRTLESSSIVSSEVIIVALPRVPKARATRSCRPAGAPSSSAVPGLPLVLHDLLDDLADLVEDLRLALAERHLVGDLVEVAERPAALAVEAADGQVDLLQGAEDLLDLLGQPEGRQVQHDAGPHAGADVGRAGGQVAELRAEGVGELRFEQVVDAVDVAARPRRGRSRCG